MLPTIEDTYQVVVNYSSSSGAAESVAEEIRSLGGSSMVIKANVSDVDSIKAMVKQVVEEWGTIDVLINNAGQISHEM